MAPSYVKRLGASVLLSLMLTVGLVGGALGAAPPHQASVPSAGTSQVAKPAHVVAAPKSGVSARTHVTPARCDGLSALGSRLSWPDCSTKSVRPAVMTKPAAHKGLSKSQVKPASPIVGAHSIKGKVTGTGGAPVRGIEVDAFEPGDDFTAWTGIDGTYSVAVPAGAYLVAFSDPSGAYFDGYYSKGGFTVDANVADQVFVASADAVGINVRLETGHHITGRVTDPHGNPLPTAEVDADSGNYHGTVYTSQNGTYSLAVPSDEYEVSFSDPIGVYIGGYYSISGLTIDESQATLVDVGSSDTGGIDASLIAGHQIKGTVTGTAGVPLNNVVVEAYNDLYDGFAATAADGTYSLAVPDGVYTVDFADPGYVYYGSYYSSSGLTLDENFATPVTVDSGDTSGIDIQLGTGYYIRGTVTGTGGAPVGNIEVDANSDFYEGIAYTATDGTYAVSVPSGIYAVSFADLSGVYFDGFYSASGFTVHMGSATLVQVDTADVPNIDISLGTGQPISGKVTGTGGVALHNIVVEAYSPDYQGYAFTDPTGNYSVAVPASTYEMYFIDPTGTYLDGFYSTTGFTVHESEATPLAVDLAGKPNINIQLQTGHHIKGTVTDVDGDPLGNIEVGALWSDYESDTFTAGNGTYSVVVPAGSPDVCFNDPSEVYMEGCYSDSGFTDDFSATPVPVTTSDVNGIDVEIPTVLNYLILDPVGATISSGGSQTYTAEGFDALDNDLGDFTSTTVFTIDGGGSCKGATCTSSVAGDHTVTGINGDSEGDTVLTVTGPTYTTYHPITPVRVLDTRSGTGLKGKLTAGVPRTFAVAGKGGIPAGADAITANATVVNSSAASSIYLGPSPIAHPSTFTLSFNKGQIANRGITVALSATGSLSVTYRATTGTTDLVLDVSGYFTPGSGGDTYHPLTPARVVDTRVGVGLKGGLKANTPATFAVWGHGGVPKNAKAVTGNVTVVNPTNAWAVYIGPAPVAKPAASTINFTRAQVQGNSVTVALSSTGTLSATYMSTKGAHTDLVFDVTGYFTADATGLRYVSLVPSTLVDTRTATGLTGKVTANTPRTFAVRGHAGVAANAAGITGIISVVNQTSPWALFVGPVASSKPTTSNLNFGTKDVCSNGVTVALSSTGSLSVTYMSGAKRTTDVVLYVTGYFVK